jgi:hypothetical protein
MNQHLVFPREPRRDGITFQGVRYNSLALQNLLNQLEPSAKVKVRFDPLDLTHVYVHDRGREEWIECFLVVAPTSHQPKPILMTIRRRNHV